MLILGLPILDKQRMVCIFGWLSWNYCLLGGDKCLTNTSKFWSICFWSSFFFLFLVNIFLQLREYCVWCYFFSQRLKFVRDFLYFLNSLANKGQIMSSIPSFSRFTLWYCCSIVSQLNVNIISSALTSQHLRAERISII